MPIFELATAEETARAVAHEIARLVRERHRSGGAVLGLATGSTPIAVYRELVRLHHEEGLDFSRVKTFNLDEYYGLAPDDPGSFHRYMHEHLFGALTAPGRGIDPLNVHILRGDLTLEQVPSAASAYEQAIRDAGGIDLQLLGIGLTGHIGFNEPGSDATTRTRLVKLADETRADAARAFGGLQQVPTEAISMGVGTILEARRLVLMAVGARKAEILRRAIEAPPGPELPASFLQRHPGAAFFVDQAAASRLARAGARGAPHAATVLHGDRVLLPGPGGRLSPQRAAIFIGPDGDIIDVVIDPRLQELPAGARRVDGCLAPGYVDLQSNGSYGADVALEPERALRTLALRLPEQGVTAVLPTLVSSSASLAHRVLQAAQAARGLEGAEIAGVHLEGPFLNPERRGAHAPDQLRPPDLAYLEAATAGTGGGLRILTLAPELPGALDVVAWCRDRGVVASAGHTEATEEEMAAAIRCGVSLVTHATNAMPKVLEEGLLKAAAEAPGVHAGVIADGIHVAPELLKMLWTRFGPDRLFLVTDAAPLAGCGDGPGQLAGVAVEKRDGAVRVRGARTLAGSALTLDRAVQNLVTWGVPLADAVEMASATPARAARLEHLGELAPGRRANLVVLDPATGALRETIVRGVTRYSAPER